MGRDTTARARYGERQVELEDPYRFAPILSDFDVYLLGEGTHMDLYEKLGAHPMVIDGVAAVAFAVFAPAPSG
jgi:1,4-alpha-glucan branching enzyme